MPKLAKELSALEVGRLKSPGMHAVGGVAGLHLAVGLTGSRSWILRATVGGKRRDVGLGAFPGVGLADAKRLAREFREQVAAGVDPVAERAAARAALAAAQAARITFDQAAEQFIASKAAEWKNAKQFALNENVVFLTGNGFPRKVVFTSTDGGATWQDITSNITAFGGGNLNAVLFHDVNNGSVISLGGVLFKTTNGGASWTHDIAPTSSLFNTLAFSPKTVPPAITFENRKVFVSGFALPNVAGHIMEYGNPANVNVNTTEAVTNASCTNPTGGSITVNTTGGIAPYTYSINGGAFQSSNSFTGLTQGPKTIVVKDAFCGTITKTINIGFSDKYPYTHCQLWLWHS